MRRELLLALAVSMLLPATLPAQRGGHHGGGSQGGGFAAAGTHWGASAPQRAVFQSFPILPLYYNQLYYGSPGGYDGGFSYSLPYGSYGYAPADYSSSVYSRPVVVVQAPASGEPLENRIVYVPSYLRPDPGPSLGEIARALRAQRSAKSSN